MIVGMRRTPLMRHLQGLAGDACPVIEGVLTAALDVLWECLHPRASA